MAIDQQKLDAFVGRAVNDLGASISALLLHIGDKLGLYKAMAGAGPLTSQQLAEKTGTAERYVREWLANQAAGGYVTYDAASHTFSLTEEQAFCLANEDSPAFFAGGFESLAASLPVSRRFLPPFATDRESGGTSMTPGCSPGQSDSSVQVITPTS